MQKTPGPAHSRVTPSAISTIVVQSMPRDMGMRWGVKDTRTGCPTTSERPCSISGMWRWLDTPYACMPSVTSQ